MKSIEEILAQADELFEQNEVQKVEQLYLEALNSAGEHQDLETMLALYNELIGYYRQLSQKEKLMQAIEKAEQTADAMNLGGTIPYATTLLNIATGYRSMGELSKAENYYKKVEEIYGEKLMRDDLLWANYYNNISLLYQEKEEYDRSAEALLQALEIVTVKQVGFEIAVTYANLANTFVIKKEYRQAKEYAKEAMKRFEERGTIDPHYCAALYALAICCEKEQEIQEAEELYGRALKIVENSVGRNAQYYRILEGIQRCRAANGKKGMEICKEYYEKYGKPMIEEQFSQYKDKIAIGLVGEGSDCYGYDDNISRDHDWGPGFCMWVTRDTYEAIGQRLTLAYEALPGEWEGIKRAPTLQGKQRRGVMVIEDFYERILGTPVYEKIDFSSVEDYALAACVNGEIFTDPQGIFTQFRRKLQEGYPERILYLKLARDMASISQYGQYNYERMLERGEKVAADLMLLHCMEHMMYLVHHMNNQYPPHDKWLYRSTLALDEKGEVAVFLQGLRGCLQGENTPQQKKKVSQWMQRIGEYFAGEMYGRGFISDTESYLDYHTEELLKKASMASCTNQELVDQIVKLEFQAFDQVKNEGGRAYCQNDWPTFSIMRKSQYLSWTRPMLMQYLYDFDRELTRGHNLITEKYGRMMESTAPERYRELAPNFPEISEEKKNVIEQIVTIQMNMAEEFSKEYPSLMENARRLHTYEDEIWDTSYETYLRGEISTYSDKMLQLYGGYVVNCVTGGINICRITIENTAKLYGFSGLSEFHEKSRM